MVTVNKAQTLILSHAFLPEKDIVEVKLSDALDRITAKNIMSPVNHPLFDNSAMDGYAIKYDDYNHDTSFNFEVIGEIKAGDPPDIEVKKGQAVRIFTGSPIPDGTDTVVMQEHVIRNKNNILIKDPKLPMGANVRKEGEQIEKGNQVVPKNTKLNPASIGLLASLGIQTVSVYPFPAVSIIVTGNEFARKGHNMVLGMIFESNGIMLQTALTRLGIHTKYGLCTDDLNKLKTLITAKSTNNNILIITGGVSVGDYDYTSTALEELGFTVIFHKVAQKPGKPILFAQKGNTFLFGLPGNPRSALMSFYEYVYPFINKMKGNKELFLQKMYLPLYQDYNKKKKDVAYFLTGKIRGNCIEILEKQGSHILTTFASANVLVFLPEKKHGYQKGEIVEVHLLL